LPGRTKTITPAKNNKAKYYGYCSQTKVDKKIRDLDEVIDELDKAELRSIWIKVNAELEGAMKKIDMAKIKMDVDKAMKEVDMEKIKAEWKKRPKKSMQPKLNRK